MILGDLCPAGMIKRIPRRVSCARRGNGCGGRLAGNAIRRHCNPAPVKCSCEYHPPLAGIDRAANVVKLNRRAVAGYSLETTLYRIACNVPVPVPRHYSRLFHSSPLCLIARLIAARSCRSVRYPRNPSAGQLYPAPSCSIWYPSAVPSDCAPGPPKQRIACSKSSCLLTVLPPFDSLAAR